MLQLTHTLWAGMSHDFDSENAAPYYGIEALAQFASSNPQMSVEIAYDGMEFWLQTN